MLFTIAMGALLFSQAAAIVEMEDPVGPVEQRDVAYDVLAAGGNAEAVRVLEMLRRDNPDDPALLINLGTAYAETGDLSKAEEAYRAAASSDERYSLELADGTWIDSRRAARQALRELQTVRLALK